jgi:hypothetical protein
VLICIVQLFGIDTFSYSIIGSIWKKLIGNGDNVYKFFLKWIWDSVVYVKPCFVTLVGSNAKVQGLNLVHGV